jgi:hypothetical protein
MTSIGDFVVTIDSIRVNPESVTDGDTLSVQLFGRVQGRSCYYNTVITTRAGPRVEFTVYGYRKDPPGECQPLEERRLRVPVIVSSHAEAFTVVARLPNDHTLERSVPVIPPGVAAMRTEIAHSERCLNAATAASAAVDSVLRVTAAGFDSATAGTLPVMTLYAVDRSGEVEPTTVRVWARSRGDQRRARHLALTRRHQPWQAFEGCPIRHVETRHGLQ